MKASVDKVAGVQELEVFRLAHNLVLEIYRQTKKFPKEETFGLSSQMQRAAVSVTSNIAEGFGRQTYKEKVQFYYVAQGSLTELKNQIIIAKDIGYLEIADFQQLDKQSNISHQLLQGLITKSKTFINLKS